MEPPKPAKKKIEYSLHNLFAAKEKSFNDYIDQLADWKLLKFCDNAEFKEYLTINGGDKGAEIYTSMAQ